MKKLESMKSSLFESLKENKISDLHKIVGGIQYTYQQNSGTGNYEVVDYMCATTSYHYPNTGTIFDHDGGSWHSGTGENSCNPYEHWIV